MSFLFCTRELIARSLSASGEAPGFPTNRRQVVGKERGVHEESKPVNLFRRSKLDTPFWQPPP